jgi:hypothetical protein
MSLAQLIAGFGYFYGNAWAFVFGVGLFIMTFNMAIGPISWVYCAEVTVDSAMGLVLLVMYASALEQVLVMEYLIAGIGVNGALWLFSFENFLCLIFCLVFVKETRGLNDI